MKIIVNFFDKAPITINNHPFKWVFDYSDVIVFVLLYVKSDQIDIIDLIGENKTDFISVCSLKSPSDTVYLETFLHNYFS